MNIFITVKEKVDLKLIKFLVKWGSSLQLLKYTHQSEITMQSNHFIKGFELLLA